MERTNRAVTSRKNRTNARNARGMYVDGNAVRRLQEVPARPYQAPERRPRGEFVKICRRDRQLNRDSSVGKHRETEKKQRAWDEVLWCSLQW